MNKESGINLNSLTVPLSKEQQLNDLCNKVKCTLKPSPIHGIGVFALRDIQKGARMYCVPMEKPYLYTLNLNDLKQFDTVFPEIKELILARWPNVVNRQPFLSPNYDARLISFMNHSDTPNYDPKTDTALRDIKAGEEVTEDYRIVENYEQVFPWLGDNSLAQKKKNK